MKVPSFLRLFGKRKSGGRERKRPEAARRIWHRPLQLDLLEDRTLLATLPLPQVLGHTMLAQGGGNRNTPSIAVDPRDSQKAVAVYSRFNPPQAGTQKAFIEASFTVNGGQTWLPFGTFFAQIDPTSNPMNPQPYAQATDPNVAFDRAGNFYMVHAEHNADAPTFQSTGAIVFTRFSFGGGAPALLSARNLYHWVASDSALKPTLAVDATLPTFTDPDTGAVQTNPSAGTIYVAWGTQNTPPPAPADQSFNPNTIKILSSSDGGLTWGGQVFSSPFNQNFGTATTVRYASPRLAVSQGTADGRVPPGTVTVVWDNFGPASDQITQADARQSQINVQTLRRGIGLGFSPTLLPAGIADAAVGMPNHIPAVTNIPITVNITNPGFVSLADLDVKIALTHPNISELLIELIAPDGTSAIVLNNRTLANGNQRMGIGAAGQHLGVNQGILVGTTFDEQAGRIISVANGAAPHSATYRPEGFFFPFLNRTAAQLNGTWILRITDHRNSPPGMNDPPSAVRLLELNMTSGLTGLGVGAVFSTLVRGAALLDYPGVIGSGGANTPAAYPDFRIGPNPVVASDNTLGSFSPYQGRIYLAYTDFLRFRNPANQDVNPADNTDIVLRFSDDAGLTWSTTRKVNNDDSYVDGYTEAGVDGFGRSFTGRPQFQPQLAVDQATGTLVVTFFDTRDDAARARVSTYLATSIDGGQTFGPQTYVNPARVARDAATGQNYNYEPLADSQATNHPAREGVFGFGDRHSVAVLNGRVYAVWSSNGNLGRDAMNVSQLGIRFARVAIASGPRIVSSTMGPVKSTTVDGVTFNNTFNGDGTRRADSFVVEFDRVVSPVTFTTDQVSVIFRNPTTAATAPGVALDVIGITALDAGLFGPGRAPGATRFLVRFDPTKAQTQGGGLVGTYSYTVGPGILDRIRFPELQIQRVGNPITFNATGLPLRVPFQGEGGTIPPDQVRDFTRSTINVQGVSDTVVDAKVTLNINYPFTGDLVITLIAPDGTRVTLANLRPFFAGGFGLGFINTTFDDAAPLSIAQGFPPYSGSFRPETPFRDLIGKFPNGNWTLEIQDLFPFDNGQLVSWSLQLQPGFIASSVRPGNLMDQDNDGITGEAGADLYATPRTLGTTPLRPPFDLTTLPLIVPGPTVAFTRVPGAPITADNVVLDGTVSGLDVTFDRDMDPASFTPAQILRIMGPAGALAGPFTVTANPANTDPALARRTFRVGFPTQILSGTYVITLGSGIRSAVGDALDVNQNAGLDVMRDIASVGSTNAGVLYNSTNVPVTLPANRTAVSTIAVPDNFVVQGATLRLDITHTNTPDLSAVLIAPDGAEVRLFTKVGAGAPNRANFTNTVFDDASTSPIQLGAAPFFATFSPQDPLARLRNRPAGGLWTLRITNSSTSVAGRLNSWSLTLQKAVPNSGLGELAADRATVSFRIFAMGANNPAAKNAWTAVGPGPIVDAGTSRTGRIGGLALDPSDPSGNTMFVAGASGGVWKTTNFLTTDPKGPTYIPLTDFGPSFGTNIGGLAVFGRNNDPNQSIVFAATGEGDDPSRGVGFLRSMDGGATWTLLDSTNNVDANGNPTPISSALRDHVFANTTTFKVVVDPRPTVNGEVIVYAAVSDFFTQDIATNRAGGVWRSLNSGKSWQRMRAGQATDVVLSPQTASETTGHLQVVYAAFRGDGVYISPNQGQVWNLMTGTVGVPLIRDALVFPPEAIPVTAPSSTPNGAKGRISLAVPAATGDKAKDTIYAGFLYAFVATPGGRHDGLYLTKDFGQNWTRVRVPACRPPTNVPQGANSCTIPANATPTLVFPSNDIDRTDNDVFAAEGTGQGNYDQSLVVDPTNPNIVYVGGADAEGSQHAQKQDRTPVRLMRVDVTRLTDPHSLVAYSNNESDGGNVLFNTDGPISVSNWRLPVGRAPFGSCAFGIDPTPYTNFIRDPDNIFLNNATLLVCNVARFNNTGADARWTPFADVLEGSVDQHRAISFIDPTTGKARLVFGDDQGVFSGIDDGTGRLVRDIGGTAFATGTRNGNLQITQFYYGAAQPSILAAEIAGSLFYGTNQDTGYPKSKFDILRTGDLGWRGIGGDGTGVATDQTGSGTAYAYLWPCCGGLGTNFFTVSPPPTPELSPGIGRTFGLLQQNLPGDTPDPQWPFAGGFNLAVNPLNGNQAVLGSLAGRVFRTQNQGLTWFEIGPPAELDSTIIQSFAYGAPDPRAPGQQGNLDDFIYAGTTGGRIFVTFTGGGGAPGNRWLNISQGLDGSPVEAIAANPNRGSKEVYAVTQRGVYFMADSRAATPAWQNITGNLFSVTHNPFGDAALRENRLKYLTSLAADWRYQLPNNGQPGRKFPVLYVGGEGGVYRSIDSGRTWRIFPDTTDGAAVPGGYLPNAQITDLDLVLGNVNPNTGHPDQSAGFNLLMASTYGRGVFAIRLPEVPGITPFSGPRVVAVDPTAPVSPGFNAITITFSGPVDPQTFTPASIRSFLGPLGNVTVVSVQDLQDPITRQPQHTTYRITFTGVATDGVYTIVIGPEITDFGGNKMNQDADSINGEETEDRFSARFVLNTSDNGRFVTGLYNDLLRRRSDTNGFLQFINVVDAARAQALGPVARIYVTSAEARGLLIADYYQTSSPTTIGNFLRRPASPADIAAWVQFLQAGATPQQVVNMIIGSAEYYQSAGGTDLAFIDRAFRDLLGRNVDAAGRDAFLALLAQAPILGRMQVASLITGSQEYLTRIVVTTYQTYLKRGAGAADVNVWLPLLSSKPDGTPGSISPQEQFVRSIFSSGEYFQGNGNTNRTWVASLYTNLLRRTGSAAEIDATLGVVLDFYNSQRFGVAETFFTSAEARRMFILNQYSTLLRRSPLDQEVDNWLNLFRGGLKEEQMVSVIVGSPEYFLRQASNNLTQFLDQAYQDLLGRARGAAETALLNPLLSGLLSRQQVTDVIIGSIEYRRRVIGGYFRTYLNREGSLPEIDSLAAFIAQGARYSQVLATILSSREYFLATHPYP